MSVQEYHRKKTKFLCGVEPQTVVNVGTDTNSDFDNSTRENQGECEETVSSRVN